ncbi:MAG: endonuclease/exonuclease/phosphatase [Ignavibacteria bacterium]|nr:endonuclease/exonuclease/phosphatase [Ignavibacteria bacterium]
MTKFFFIPIFFIILLKLNAAPIERQIKISSNPYDEGLYSIDVRQELNGNDVPAPLSSTFDNYQRKKITDYLLETDTTVDVDFITRIHPLFTNNQLDTARVLTSQTNPSNKYYIGDRTLPRRVVDAQGNLIKISNGFAQIVPSLTYFYPELSKGTFFIDSVRFSPYSYPSSPVKSYFSFFISNMLTDAGKSSFQGFKLDFDKIYNDLQDLISLTPNEINSKSIPAGGNSFTIQPTTINLAGHDEMATVPSKNTIAIVLFKDDLTNLSDTLGIIGAYEWTVSQRNQTFAGAIFYYPNKGVDTLELLFTSIGPPRPADSIAYPTLMKEKWYRLNYNMHIYGKYKGEIVLNVEPISKNSVLFELKQNYPNPVVTATNINFTLLQGGQTNLTIFNSLGQQITETSLQYLAPGEYSIRFDSQDFPDGIYYYSLTSGDYTASKTLVISR